MKSDLLLFIVIIHISGKIIAFERQAIENDSLRSSSIYFGLGALELINLGVNFQQNEKHSIGLVSNLFVLGGKEAPIVTIGIGIKGVYFFSPNGKENFLWSNMISIDLLYLLKTNRKESNKNKAGGLGIEALIGRDCIIGKGIGLNWGIGIGMGFHGEEGTVVFPAFKLGLHYNF